MELGWAPINQIIPGATRDRLTEISTTECLPQGFAQRGRELKANTGVTCPRSWSWTCVPWPWPAWLASASWSAAAGHSGCRCRARRARRTAAPQPTTSGRAAWAHCGCAPRGWPARRAGPGSADRKCSDSWRGAAAWFPSAARSRRSFPWRVGSTAGADWRWSSPSRCSSTWPPRRCPATG